MKEYKTRKIAFKELLVVDEWKVKVYTISKSGDFNHSEFYQKVKDKLSEWFKMENSFDSRSDKVAFIILHSGTEGIFTLVNWWVGKNMLNTHIFISNHNQTSDFTLISGDGLAPCIWELEVINHERLSWTTNVLKKIPNPCLEEYLNDTINVEV